MTAKGCTLLTGESLGVGDYLTSANGLFFAILQGDGNFCVYLGSGPDNNHGFKWGSVQSAQYTPTDGQHKVVMQSDGNFCGYKVDPSSTNFLWGSVQLAQYSPAEGKYSAVMQDDGNFCVYRDGQPSALFCTKTNDPITSFEVSGIEYDLAAAKTLQSGPAELYRQTVRNDSQTMQNSSISGSATVTETYGWSLSIATKIGVSTKAEVGIPLVGSGDVTVSMDVTVTLAVNGSKSTAKAWSFNSPVSVPPHTTVVGLVSASLSTIAVPFTLSGTAVLQSGARLPGKQKGLYTGTNSHDLTVTFIQQDSGTSRIRTTTNALEAALT